MSGPNQNSKERIRGIHGARERFDALLAEYASDLTNAQLVSLITHESATIVEILSGVSKINPDETSAADAKSIVELWERKRSEIRVNADSPFYNQALINIFILTPMISKAAAQRDDEPERGDKLRPERHPKTQELISEPVRAVLDAIKNARPDTTANAMYKMVIALNLTEVTIEEALKVVQAYQNYEVQSATKSVMNMDIKLIIQAETVIEGLKHKVVQNIISLLGKHHVDHLDVIKALIKLGDLRLTSSEAKLVLDAYAGAKKEITVGYGITLDLVLERDAILDTLEKIAPSEIPKQEKSRKWYDRFIGRK